MQNYREEFTIKDRGAVASQTLFIITMLLLIQQQQDSNYWSEDKSEHPPYLPDLASCDFFCFQN
jgi:hypothetical protein